MTHGRVDMLEPQPWDRLARSVAELGGHCPAAGPSLTGLAWDSRDVRPGDLFVAVRGAEHDGHHHLAEAARAGAAALVVVEPPADRPAPLVVVPDGRRALSAICARLFGDPGRQMGLVGVTGTDGKTTTTHLTAAVLRGLGLKTCAVSTVAFLSGDGTSVPNLTDMTTPEAPILHRFLAEQLLKGVSTGVVEVTSHALVQHRVADCSFQVAVLTNLTPEHLDFHGSFEAYATAKGQLLDLLVDGAAVDSGVLVTAAEDPELERFRRRWPGRQLEFGTEAGDLRAVQIQERQAGTGFNLLFRGQEQPVQSQLIGRHNLLNSLAAAAVGLASGGRLDQVAVGLGRFAGVAGRLQRVDRGQPFCLIVDFAHTVHGLEEVLGALRARTRGRIWVVFGSAGGRDASKRPGLGQTVARLADRAILTTDDPRHESPAAIAAEISAGMEVEGWRDGAQYRVLLDRAAAVRAAVAAAAPGDTVLLAGKGGQRQMYLSGGGVPWDDVAVAEASLAELGYSTPG